MLDPHTALYLRVSSKSQDLRSQEADLTRWSKSVDEPVVWYTDKVSGTTMDRPSWNHLWSQIQVGKVSRVVVWRLDRLGRTARGLTELIAELIARKVGLVSVREGLDLDTPAGRMMAHVLASVAQYETEVRSERQQAGIAAAKAQGLMFGRPKGIHTSLKVTPEHRTLIARLKSEGSSIAGIARLTSLSRSTVYAVLDTCHQREPRVES